MNLLLSKRDGDLYIINSIFSFRLRIDERTKELILKRKKYIKLDKKIKKEIKMGASEEVKK